MATRDSTQRGTAAAEPGPDRRRRFGWVSLAVFAALAVLHTWPLALAPGTLSRNDNLDTVLHEWTLAWLAHQIVRDPLHLFDANIFYPDQLTLAYSDHLFIPGIFVAPLIWAGCSPVFVYNLLLIVGFTLTGWGNLVISVDRDSFEGAEPRLAAFLEERVPGLKLVSASTLDDRVSLHYQYRRSRGFDWPAFFRELQQVAHPAKVETFLS